MAGKVFKTKQVTHLFVWSLNLCLDTSLSSRPDSREIERGNGLNDNTRSRGTTTVELSHSFIIYCIGKRVNRA